MKEFSQPNWEYAMGNQTGACDPTSTKQPYTLLLPPPNITGSLHMGHALNASIQDYLARRARQNGHDTLWMPGTDHATTATQLLLTRKLHETGLTPHDIGRDAFLEYGAQWKEQSGGEIMNQLRLLGASLDYAKERYTLDEDYQNAIFTAFHKMWNAGLIFRDNRLCNYSPGLKTAISDLEITREDENTFLYYLAYPLSDGTSLEIATTSLHTIAGDAALAIATDHPDRTRLLDLCAINPLTGHKMPIITDHRARSDFGTGALKITPAHSHEDYAIATDHNLAWQSAINTDGTMSELYQPWSGITIEQARDDAPKTLAAYITRTEAYTQSIPRCERSHTRIETLPMPQWYLDMRHLNTPLYKRMDEITIFPPEQKPRMEEWLSEQKPWCISRQLWWGSRLPLWEKDGEWQCSQTKPGEGWEQSDDIFDTWFSSALWSFAALGWPNDTAFFEKYYPAAAIISGRDILNLWIGRMLALGLYFTGQLPFTTIYLHSTILTADGKRMSKSLGNGIDPRDLITKYGADATRWGILRQTSTQDIRFQTTSLERSRRTLRKLENAHRLLGTKILHAPIEPKNDLQHWFEKCLDSAHTTIQAAEAIGNWSGITASLEKLIEEQYCDLYLEAYKADRASEQAYAEGALARIFMLAAPIAPYLCEYLNPQSLTTCAEIFAYKETDISQMFALIRDMRFAEQLTGEKGTYCHPKRLYISHLTGWQYKDGNLLDKKSTAALNDHRQKERTRQSTKYAQLAQKLTNPGFLAHASPETQAKTRAEFLALGKIMEKKYIG